MRVAAGRCWLADASVDQREARRHQRGPDAGRVDRRQPRALDAARLPDGRWRTARIATLRNDLVHTGARIVRRARITTLVFNESWAATGALIRALARLRKLRTAIFAPV